MYKWRAAQNVLAALISLETIAFLSLGTYYAILMASQENIQTVIAVNHFGGAEYIAAIGGSAVFIGCALLFAFRDRVTEYVLLWGKVIQESRNEYEEDEDDE